MSFSLIFESIENWGTIGKLCLDISIGKYGYSSLIKIQYKGEHETNHLHIKFKFTLEDQNINNA